MDRKPEQQSRIREDIAMLDVLIYLLLIGAAVYAFGAVWAAGELVIKIIRRARHERHCGKSKRANRASG